MRFVSMARKDIISRQFHTKIKYYSFIYSFIHSPVHSANTYAYIPESMHVRKEGWYKDCPSWNEGCIV